MKRIFKGFRVNHFKKYAFLTTSILVLAFFGWFAVDRFNSSTNDVNAVNGVINPPYQEHQNLRVLVVEINPHLNSIDGSPKAMELLFGEGIQETVVEEQTNDIMESSHGYINQVNTTWIYVDDFPHYTVNFERPDGTTANQFDEDNFLAAADDGNGNYSWWNMYYGGWFDNSTIRDYTFDYEWLIETADLVERRNSGNFDQVWVVAADPTKTYETMMVGRNAYWINGTPITKDCDNFMIVSVSMSRRDAQFHALMHSQENIMKNVYGMSYDAYSENSINISYLEDYMALNPWERFMLNDYANSGTINGIGTVHHPFNASSGYNYNNGNAVRTTYSDWLNHDVENQTGEDTLENYLLWMDEPYAVDGFDVSGKEDRFYTRFWSYMMPHDSGYTSDGYLKNWWKYFYSMDYVTGISSTRTNIVAGINDALDLSYTLSYRSGASVNGTLTTADSNVAIDDETVVKYRSGAIRAVGYGTTTVEYYMDGQSIEYTVTVLPTYYLGFETYGGDEVATQTCQPVNQNQGCTVMIPATAPTKAGYDFFGYAEQSGSTVVAYEPGDEYTFSTDTVSKMLYAIFIDNAMTWTGDSIYTKGSGDSLIASMNFNRNIFERALVDDVELSLSEYSIDDNQTIVTLDNEYLDSLEVGDHTLTLEFSGDHSQSGTFTVAESYLQVYTLSFGDNVVEAQTCQSSDPVSACSVTIPMAAPTKAGNDFFGYAETPGLATAAYQPGDTYSFTISSTTKTLYAIFIDNSMTWTGDNHYDKSGSDSLVVSMNFARDIFERALVDGNQLTSSEYSIAANQVVVTLNNNYLDSLSEGEHTLTLQFMGNHSKSGTFIVENSYSQTYTLRFYNDVKPVQTCESTDPSLACFVTIPAVAPTQSGSYFFGYTRDNSSDIASSMPGSTFTFTLSETEVMLYPIFRDGAMNWQTSNSFRKDETGVISVRINFPRMNLAQVSVDGTAITSSSYTVTSGSTIISLKNAYLKSLSAGEHTLRAVYDNSASAETTFTITEAPVDPDPPVDPNPPVDPDPDPPVDPDPVDPDPVDPDPQPGDDDDDEEEIPVPNTGSYTSDGGSVVIVTSSLTGVIISAIGIIIYFGKRKKYFKERF